MLAKALSLVLRLSMQILVSFEKNASVIDTKGCNTVADIIGKIYSDDQLDIPYCRRVSLQTDAEVPIDASVGIQELVDMYEYQNKNPFVVKCTRVNSHKELDEMPRPPIRTAIKRTEESPFVFPTSRDTTVHDFVNLLYPDESERYPPPRVVLLQGPSLSGKSGLALLLYKKLSEDKNRSVIYINGDLLKNRDMKVDHIFIDAANESIYNFVKRREDRVIIFDNCQKSFDDRDFWIPIVKHTINSFGYPDLKIVLFSSYCDSKCDLPITIPPEAIFGLHNSPGIDLKRDEFEEMITQDPRLKSHSELLWTFCSKNIGVAGMVLQYLLDVFQSRPVISNTDILAVLVSARFLVSPMLDCKGMPHEETLMRLVKAEGFPEDSYAVMKDVLDKVAQDHIADIRDFMNIPNPRKFQIFNLLLSFGCLSLLEYNNKVTFASDVHLQVWLHSSRKAPCEPLGNISLPGAIFYSVKRISSSRLYRFRFTNGGYNPHLRWQIQMEVYTTLISILPDIIFVYPTARTIPPVDLLTNVDLVVVIHGIFWFLEILVDESSDPRASRENGSYNRPSRSIDDSVVLDFRTASNPEQRQGGIYITFTEGFKQAKIIANSKPKFVDLSD
jgi:hypothetical protein